MTKLIPLLLCLWLLCGCAAQNPQPAAVPETVTAPAETAETVPVQYLQKTEANSALQIYAAPSPVHGILADGEALILFSGEEQTALLSVDTATLGLLGSHKAGFPLMAENMTVQKLNRGISYFHGSDRQTVVLDHSLREIKRIDAPEDLQGFPLLSQDSSTLYYCTGNAVRALDVDTGISRVLKEASYPVQGLSGLLLGDTVAQISVTDADGSFQTMFLSTDNGQLLHGSEGNLLPQASSDTFFLHTPNCGLTSVLFGHGTEGTMILQPENYDGNCFFLPDTGMAVNVHTTPTETTLDLYDLNTGFRTSSLTISEVIVPGNMTQTSDGNIWFTLLDDPAVYCWDPAASSVQDHSLFISPYYTKDAPDYEGLAACSLYAQEMEDKYGIEILIYKDAVVTQPWDYRLEYEYQAAVLQQELQRLDAHLSNFPDGFLSSLTEKFTGVTVSIVRSAAGSPESGSLEAVNGIQFFEDFHAYIVLATDHDTEYALYHELSHLMETVVLTESVAYDRWDNLNPENFSYDNDYLLNRTRDGSPWLKSGSEYFIDTYSMSYAKEDRARLFEYAMTAGHEELFRSPNLQSKLRQLSIGIREGFGLKNTGGRFLWEQYLDP